MIYLKGSSPTDAIFYSTRATSHADELVSQGITQCVSALSSIFATNSAYYFTMILAAITLVITFFMPLAKPAAIKKSNWRS